MEIRRAEKKDAVLIARLHMVCIPWGFLSSFGERFVSLLYESLLRSSHSAVFVAYEGDNIAGFVSGTLSLKKAYIDFFKKYFLKIFPTLLIKSFSLSSLSRIKETSSYGLSDDKTMPEAELISIAVASGYQRQGLAKKLFQTLREWFAEKAVITIKTTVGEKNIKSNSFFKLLGFEESGSVEIHKGETSVIYIYDIERGTLG